MKTKNITKSQTDEPHGYLTAFSEFENKVEKMFQRFWNNSFKHDKVPDLFSYGALGDMPKMDVIDREKEILVKAELPGFDKKDLEVSITNNQLVIKAKTCHEEKEEKGDYLKQEINQSEIYRSVLLPAEVDEEKVKTSFKNGVLKLTIPKLEKSYRRKIDIE